MATALDVAPGHAPPLRVPRARVAPTNMYYNVQVAGVRLGDVDLPFSAAAWEAGYGTILDSGTTFSFVPLETAAALEAELRRVVAAGGWQEVRRAPFKLCFATCALLASPRSTVHCRHSLQCQRVRRGSDAGLLLDMPSHTGHVCQRHVPCLHIEWRSTCSAGTAYPLSTRSPACCPT